MKNKKVFLKRLPFIFLMFISFQGMAQEIPANTFTDSKNILKRKGNFFFYWGYNRAAYSKSDMHFWGEGYNFTLTDVVAKDMPTKDFYTYIKPNAFTVPQYNYRLGYYLTDKIFVSVGSDHMKYVVSKQATRITGSVSTGINSGSYSHTEIVIGEGRLAGNYRNVSGDVVRGRKFTRPVNPDQILHSGNGHHGGTILDSLPGGFLSGFEHCDGLNDVSLEIGGIDQLWLSKNTKHGLVIHGAIGLGMVIPDTEAYVLEQEAWHNKVGPSYRLAGGSASGIIGIDFRFCSHFFLQTRLKGGFINLPKIRTTVSGGKASQHFLFLETMTTVGFSFKFGK